MFDVIVLAIMQYGFLVVLITFLLNFNRGPINARYWYYLKIWYFIHLIPDMLIWGMYFFGDVPLPYRYGFTDLIKFWPFISAFFSTILTAGFEEKPEQPEQPA